MSENVRLIDANKIAYEDIECTDGNTYMVAHAPMIETQPTAYDVDAVAEQIKKELLPLGSNQSNDTLIEKIIKIIKGE